jgi:hypothetical protein
LPNRRPRRCQFGMGSEPSSEQRRHFTGEGAERPHESRGAGSYGLTAFPETGSGSVDRGFDEGPRVIVQDDPLRRCGRATGSHRRRRPCRTCDSAEVPRHKDRPHPGATGNETSSIGGCVAATDCPHDARIGARWRGKVQGNLFRLGLADAARWCRWGCRRTRAAGPRRRNRRGARNAWRRTTA